MNNLSRPLAAGVVVEDVSPAELYEVVTGASSQDPTLSQTSAKRLIRMLDMRGTFDGLHEIASQRTLPLNVRQMAMIQFKNAASNHWRSRKVLSDEERVRIRARSLTFLDEEDETIANCNEVIVSKIARQDYPHNWPNAVNELMAIIDTNLQQRYSSSVEDPRTLLVLRRSLHLLNGIIKEFAAFKMLKGVQTMTQMVEQLRLVLHGYYTTISATGMTPQSVGVPRTYNDMVLAHLVLKCVTKMAIWLWQKADKVVQAEFEPKLRWIQQLFSETSTKLKTLVELRHQVIVLSLTTDPQVRKSVDILTRHIRLFGKYFRRLSQLSQSRFVELPMCGDLVLFYWSQVVQATSEQPGVIADSNEALYPIRYLVQGMTLFKENLAQWAPTRRDGTPNNNVLSKDFIETAVKLVVTRFMPLNPADLESWMIDPEEWVNTEDKESEQWEYEIRACSERVLMQLANQFTDFVTPLLLTTFNEIAVQPAVDLQSVVQKEALYCAIGRCDMRLKDVIPFEQWLQQTIAVETRDTNPNFPIIKRRIAWLIGKWVSDSCTSPNNPLIWEILTHLLTVRGEGTDLVVRLTAAMALRECVDTVDFDADVFAPFLPSVVSELVKLMGEADTLETKRRVGKTLNVIIAQTGTRIVPFVGIITEPLPGLWTDAGDDWLFKTTLLLTVTNLIEAIKGQSTPLGAVVVPLIRECMSPGARATLDEDGLILWAAALRNTLTAQSVNGAPALIDLFPDALTTLGTNLDLLGSTIGIVESYFILDGTKILQTCAVDVFRAFLATLQSTTITLNQKDMVNALNLLVQSTPSALWGEALHISGLFAHLLHKLIEGEASFLLLMEHIFLLSRIVMADRQMFLQLMSVTAPALNMTETKLYEGLLDQWWAKFDNMSEPRQRKLCAMGMASLVSTGRPEVLERVPTEIFNVWLDVFGEMKEAQNHVPSWGQGLSPVPSPDNFKRHWELDEAPRSYYQDTEGTPEYDRRKAIYDADPVRTIQLSSYVAQHLREAESICGTQVFQQNYLSKADPTVLKQIQDELIRT